MPDLKKKRASGSSDLTMEITDLKWSIVHAVDLYKRTNQSRRALALSFLKGVSSTLGAIVTVVIILPVVVWALRSVAWPPIIERVVSTVISQIEQSNHQSQPRVVDQ